MIIKDMQEGKIYFVSYGGNTQLVFRFKKFDDFLQYHYYDALHYWNGYETFYKSSGSCVQSGIDEIRRATKAEKHALIRFEIEYDCI